MPIQTPRRMLLLVAVAEILGMTLWFSATAAAPRDRAGVRARRPATRAWLTMAVQAGFVAGTLVTALTNLADVINARRLFAAGCVAGAACNAGDRGRADRRRHHRAALLHRARRSPGSIRRG